MFKQIWTLRSFWSLIYIIKDNTKEFLSHANVNFVKKSWHTRGRTFQHLTHTLNPESVNFQKICRVPQRDGLGRYQSLSETSLPHKYSKVKLFICKSENWSFRFTLSTLNTVQLNSITHFTSLGAWLACSIQATFVRCRGVITRIAAARFSRIRWRRVANFTLVSGQHPATAIANTINYWRCGFGGEFLWANSHWPQCQRSRPARTTWGSGPYKPRAPKTSKTSIEATEHLGKESQVWKNLGLVFDMNVYVLILYLILSSINTNRISVLLNCESCIF